MSDAQLAENTQRTSGAKTDEKLPTQRVNDHEGGAKRESFFKKRDYK